MKYHKIKKDIKEIKFVIYGIAKGKAMPRVVRNKHTGKVHAFPPSKEWEKTVAGQAFKYKPDQPIEGPIALGLIFYRPMPKYISNNKTKCAIPLAKAIISNDDKELKIPKLIRQLFEKIDNDLKITKT